MTTEQRTYLYQGLAPWQLAEELDYWCAATPSDSSYAEEGTREWKFEPEFELERLSETVCGNDKATWVAWLEQECAGRAYDFGEPPEDTAYHALERWWLEPQSRYDEPLIIGYGQDGRPYIWDGWHRTAVSHKHDLKAVPAWVGYPKKTEVV